MHSYWVNSIALRLAGISDQSPSPAGGVVGLDSQGRLSGGLADTAMNLM